RTEIQYRVRADRHWECRHGHDGVVRRRGFASQRSDRGGAAPGRPARREGGRVHGEPAARCERTVHHGHGDEDAVHWPRIRNDHMSRHANLHVALAAAIAIASAVATFAADQNPFLGRWNLAGIGPAGGIYWLEIRDGGGQLTGMFLDR